MFDPTGWLANRRANPAAPTRLYCFPHSGGSPGEYLRWTDRIAGVELWAVQYPGRGSRMDEEPVRDLDTLILRLSADADFDGRFGFFGHSLGALVAYETAHKLRELGHVTPQWLFVSAYPAPHLTVMQDREPLHLSSDAELAERLLADFGDSAEQVREDPEFLKTLLNTNRADYSMVETYKYRQRPPLESAIHVVGGLDDEIPPDELVAWQRHTSREFAVHLLPGGHFYFRDNPRQLLDLLAVAAGHPSRPLPKPAKGTP